MVFSRFPQSGQSDSAVARLQNVKNPRVLGNPVCQIRNSVAALTHLNGWESSEFMEI
jgi:hypothetical protein